MSNPSPSKEPHLPPLASSLLRLLGKVLWRGFSFILTGIILIGFTVALFRSLDWGHWAVVLPPSLPAGLYRFTPADTLATGIPTLICLSGEGGELALSRGYVQDSWAHIATCPEKHAPMMKILAALPGDRVRADRDSVQINDGPWLPVPMAENDSDGRPLRPMTGVFDLAPNECYALNLWSDKSYDSRYFGPFPCPPPPLYIAHPVDSTLAASIDSLARQIRGL